MGSAAASTGARVERAVLALLLTLTYSEALTIEELVGEIGDRSGTLRALDRLEVVGLIARNDDKVKPTPAARRFDELNI
jgi:predicted transcriptional regulator